MVEAVRVPSPAVSVPSSVANSVDCRCAASSFGPGALSLIMPDGHYTHVKDYFVFLWLNNDYFVLFLGEVVTQFGNWFNLVASYEVVENHSDGSGVAFATLLVIRNLPRLVWFPFAGAVADTYNRGGVMLVVSLLQSLLAAAVPLMLRYKSLWLFFLISFFEFSLATFYDPARGALIPMVVPQHQLILSSTLDSLAWSLMAAVGASMGGFAVTSLGISGCFYIDAATFLVAGLCAVRVLGVTARHKSTLTTPDPPDLNQLTGTKAQFRLPSPFSPKIRTAQYQRLYSVDTEDTPAAPHDKDQNSHCANMVIVQSSNQKYGRLPHQTPHVARQSCDVELTANLDHPIHVLHKGGLLLSDSSSSLMFAVPGDNQEPQGGSCVLQAMPQSGESQAIQQPDFQAVQQPDSQVVQQSGSQAVQHLDSQALQHSDSQAVQHSDSKAVNWSSSEAVQQPDFQAVQQPDSQVVQWSGSQAVQWSDSEALQSDSRTLQNTHCRVDQSYGPQSAHPQDVAVEVLQGLEHGQQLQSKCVVAVDVPGSFAGGYSASEDGGGVDVCSRIDQGTDEQDGETARLLERGRVDECSTTDRTNAKGQLYALKEGFKYVLAKENRHILLFITIKACGAISWGGNDVIIAKWSEMDSMHVFGGQPETLGIVYSMVGVGCFFGPLFSNSLIRANIAGWMTAVAISFAMRTVGYLVLTYPNFWLLLGSSVFRSAGSNILWISSTALLQSTADNERQGCVFALELAVYTAALCVSTLLTGIGFDQWHWSGPFACFVLAMVTAVLLVFWTIQAYLYRKRDQARLREAIERQALQLTQQSSA